MLTKAELSEILTVTTITQGGTAPRQQLRKDELAEWILTFLPPCIEGINGNRTCCIPPSPVAFI